MRFTGRHDPIRVQFFAIGSALTVLMGCGTTRAPHPSGTRLAPESAEHRTGGPSRPAPAAKTAPETGALEEPEEPVEPDDPCAIGRTFPFSALRNPIHGSFTAPGTKEVFALLDCRDNILIFGAGVLRFVDGAWQLVRYRELESDPQCEKLAIGSGPDLLVCSVEANSYGWYSSWMITLDYQRSDGDEEVELVRVRDNTRFACGGTKEVLIATMHSDKLVDIDKDGTLDLTVLVGTMRVRIPPQPPCTEKAGVGEPPENLPNPPLQKLEFITKGRSLVPTPATARTLAKLPKS